ncbi:uncharacterized protein LOC117064071 isoform X5 [Trachypithecus francoisi]|uniref:uncharacterized protein LOC117064071 isoform X5 n=1 Tax=Trachypithecus francoisi TaxID=54180 RepID=UPI00141AF500|nr:uncharacterized protein LOC117064071 isoform X5 [Trachypithecus francoisi]
MEKGFHISRVRGRSPTFDVPFALRFPWRVSERISSDRRDPRRLPRETLGQKELFFTRMSAWISLDTRYPPGTCFSRSSADAAGGRAGPGAAGTEVREQKQGTSQVLKTSHTIGGLRLEENECSL